MAGFSSPILSEVTIALEKNILRLKKPEGIHSLANGNIPVTYLFHLQVACFVIWCLVSVTWFAFWTRHFPPTLQNPYRITNQPNLNRNCLKTLNFMSAPFKRTCCVRPKYDMKDKPMTLSDEPVLTSSLQESSRSLHGMLIDPCLSLD